MSVDLQSLRREIDWLQQKTKSVWVSSEGRRGLTRSYLLDSAGRDTVLPVYSDYSGSCSFKKNPLEVDWRQFGVHNPWDRRFIESVFRGMQDQVSLWSVDDVTLVHPVFFCFVELTNCIGRLKERVELR